MEKWLLNRYLSAKSKVNKFLKEERGEANIIAIILVVIVVIALVAIFRTQLEGIVTGLFDQIKNSLGLETTG